MVRPCGARGFGRRRLMRYLCSSRGRCHFSLAVRWQSARLRHRLCALRPRARETGAMATQYSDNIVNPNPQVFGAATPFVIRRIGLTDLSDALRLGWEDFKAVP